MRVDLLLGRDYFAECLSFGFTVVLSVHIILQLFNFCKIINKRIDSLLAKKKYFLLFY